MPPRATLIGLRSPRNVIDPPPVERPIRLGVSDWGSARC